MGWSTPRCNPLPLCRPIYPDWYGDNGRGKCLFFSSWSSELVTKSLFSFSFPFFLSPFPISPLPIVLLIAFLAPSDQEQGRLDGMALSVGWILSLGPAHYVSRKQLHDEDEASWVIRAIGLALLGILIPASLLFFPPDSLLRILSSSISQAIGSCLIGASLGLAVAPGIDESWRWAQGLRSAWAEWEGARLAEWLTMWSLAGLTLGPLLPYMLSSITSSPLDLLTWSTAALALTMAALVTVFNRAGWLYHDGYELIV